MTDQEIAQFTPVEQQLTDELTRIANRQMQVVTRLDAVQDRLTEDLSTTDELKARVISLETKSKQPASLMERIIIPLMIFNMSLTIGNVAMTLTVAIALANHMLGH